MDTHMHLLANWINTYFVGSLNTEVITHISTFAFAIRLGVVAVNMAVPPILAAYGTQMVNAFSSALI